MMIRVGMCFFFSSRRRHTRWTGDWSSDVCSSDLADGDLLKRANDTTYGLAAGIYTRDIGKAHRIANRLRAGTVWINCYNIFDAALPFGGYKQSGWGREM